MSAPTQNTAKAGPPLKKSVLLCGAGLWALHSLDPFYTYGVNIVAWGVGIALVVSVPRLASAAARWLADMMDHAAAHVPDYIKGTAKWGESLSDLGDYVLKPGLIKTGHGAVFGCLKKRGFFGLGRKPVVLALPAVTAICGSTGSGKGILHQLLNVMSVRGPKFIVDFDGTDTVMLADALRRKGERVVILNLGDKYHNILGESDCFNPLDHIVDCLERSNHGILDATEDTIELVAELIPDDKNGGSGNSEYFRDGSRDLLVLAILITVLLEGRQATLDKALSLLSDTELFLNNCKWFCGALEKEDGATAQIDLFSADWAHVQNSEDILNFARELTNRGNTTSDQITAQDNRNYLSFLTGAVQKLRPFSPGTRSSRKLQKSTFRFSEQKDDGQDVTVFIVMDNTKQQAQGKILSMIMSIAQKEWVRHPNAGGKTITLFLNEISNWIYPDLRRALTWVRKFKLHIVVYLQNFKNFDLAYGDGASDVLKSEAGIMLFLPEGMNEPDVLSFLEERIGNESIMVRNESGRRKGERGLDGYNYAEASKPLLFKDEIRRLKDRGILLVGNKKPFRPYLPPISSVARFRRQVGINPLYGKPFIAPMRLWLLRYEPWMPANIFASLRARRMTKKTKTPTTREVNQ